MSGPLHGDALLRVLTEVALGFQREQTPQGVITCAGEALRAHQLSLAILQRDGDVTRIRYANVAPELRLDTPAFEGRAVPVSQLTRVAAAGRGAVLIGDVRQATEKFFEKHRAGQLDEVPRLLDAASFQKVSMMVLVIDGQLWGGFTLGGVALEESDLPAITLFGLQLNAALQAAELNERLEQRRREQEAVNAIATMRLDAGGGTNTRVLLEAVAKATSSDSSALFIYDGATDEYVMFDEPWGAPESMSKLFRRVKPGAFPVALNTMHVSELQTGRERVEGEGFRWFANVPLELEGRRNAWLVMARRSNAGYSPTELATAATLGVQVNTLIERSRLYNQLSGRVRQLSLLFDLARAGTSAREVGPLVDRLLALLVENLPCDAASIVYVSGNELVLGGWTPRAGVGLPPTLSMPSIKLDEDSITARALRELKGQRVSLAESTGRTRKEMQAFNASHLMAAPLLVGQRKFGALMVGRLADVPFSDDELKLMDSCAAQVSVLVEHVKLFDDLRSSYSSLEKAQAEVVRHERLAALGELAAVMAHEVRNPLGVIFNSLTSLKKRAGNDGEAALLLGIVGEEADRLNRIVGDLLDFARPYEAERAPIELEPIVASAVEAASASSSAQVKVVTEFEGVLPRFVVDGHLVRQALVNLVVNAIQAMPKGGTCTVRVSAQQKNGVAQARIEVCDEGVGISPATEKHIFQPFFTTKATGTGLGLAVVKRIVDAHHGEISVRSAMGGGTTFTITLPSS
ncbi:MAG: GAF domain-containing protein [Archangiaceae bacterium]|nr:GAF domain-containing protein [Archangiaceae bacterium]